MGWSIGYDGKWKRDIGYGVPSLCDFPGCGEKIDRGLAHVCGGEPYGGEMGCGLYFCSKHLLLSANNPQVCERCLNHKEPFPPTPDVPEWTKHKLTTAEMVGCEWLEDELDGYWTTACGEMHCFTDGGPEDNHHRFCPYCGKPLTAIHCQAANYRAKARGLMTL